MQLLSWSIYIQRSSRTSVFTWKGQWLFCARLQTGCDISETFWPYSSHFQDYVCLCSLSQSVTREHQQEIEQFLTWFSSSEASSQSRSVTTISSSLSATSSAPTKNSSYWNKSSALFHSQQESCYHMEGAETYCGEKTELPVPIDDVR